MRQNNPNKEASALPENKGKRCIVCGRAYPQTVLVITPKKSFCQDAIDCKRSLKLNRHIP